MKATLFMAISANGMIADKDGNEDFLSHENWKAFSGFAKKYGNFIVGRKTYEAVQNWEEEYSFSNFTECKKIILSQSSADLPSGYISVKSPEEALSQLSQDGFEEVLIIGGSTINAAFAKKGLLDRIILNIEPAIIGKGIPLFATDDFQLRMKLVETKQATDDIIQLCYEVQK